MANKKRFYAEFLARDFLQVVIGAGILAIPVGFTQETWDLAEALPLTNVLGFLIVSVIFIAMFSYFHYYKNTLAKNFDHFVERVFFTYLVAFLVVAILMDLIGKTPWLTDSILAFKRVVLVHFQLQ